MLRHKVIALGRGQTDPKDLFLKRGKGTYIVVGHEGAYFRQPLTPRTTSKQNVITDDPLFEPLQRIGVDETGIRRLFREHSRNLISRWVRITDAAMHENPRGFPGFKVSPAAFLIDGIQNNRTPPDWFHAHEKNLQREQWNRDHIEQAESIGCDESLRDEYDRTRAVAFNDFCRSPDGQRLYEKIFPILLTFHKVTDPHSFQEAARQATLTRMEREDFPFADFAAWQRTHQGSAAKATA